MPTQRPMELLVVESTITSGGQTTIPSSIRKALQLGAGDKIRFALRRDNTVVISRGDDREAPVVSEFLAFLEADVRANPGNVRPVPQVLLTRARSLTQGVTVEVNAPLDPHDE